ncbi:MAG: hypothetical protein AB7C90_05075 [Bacteroidales bacterium]
MDQERTTSISRLLQEKTAIKQRAYTYTSDAFRQLHTLLPEMVALLQPPSQNSGGDCKVEYKLLSDLDLQLQIGEDILLFTMMPHIFQFDRDHIVWKMPLVQRDPASSYCGMINIYNFLSESILHHKEEDPGYLIGRIFINKENHFFVEGKRQTHYWVNQFGSKEIDREALEGIVTQAIYYAIDFDLLTPPYDAMKITNVAQMLQKVESSKIQTGKRLGFSFNSDDVMLRNNRK